MSRQSTANLIKNLSTKHQAILEYILSHAENDERPYLSIKVLGLKIRGLLDSGASSSIIGGPGWSVISSLGIPLNTADKTTCTVANGNTCESIGSTILPVEVEGQIKTVKMLVIPSLHHSLILGVDFWKRVGLVPDLRRGSWTFSSSESQVCDTVDTVALRSQTELGPEQSCLLNKLVNQAFAEMGDKLGCTSLVEHYITTNASPIKQRYYPVSPIMQGHINTELDKLLKEGIVEPSSSPWSSPIILVKKSDGVSWRFVVDYRKVNNSTEKDSYPLPYISATLDKLRDARYLSSLDIKSAYFQVPLAESSRPITAFTVPGRGLFQFCRLPMGLSNAPATWQRLIDRVLGPALDDHVFVYLDDIIIVTPTFEKHLEILEEVFRRLKESNLRVFKKKCQFCRPELRYLGYVVDRNGLHVDPEKVNAILKIPPPSNVTEVRRIIGLASWYRRFVPNFSTLISPLSNLTRKNQKFNWDSTCETSFQTLKDCLVSAPVLTCPDFSLPFTVQTDASGFGLGAVLSQQTTDGEKVIAYCSRSLTRNERHYTVTERECLAVIWAIEKLRPYLEGSKFTVITDHHSLLWLNNLKNPTGRLARWAIRMQQYDYTIVHRKGKEHIVPDTLSRSVPVVDSLSTPSCISNNSPLKETKDRWFINLCKKVSACPKRYSLFRLSGHQLYKYVRPRFPELASDEDFWRKVIPSEERKQLIEDAHTSLCHVGVFKTFSHLAKTMYWPKMKADVAAFIRKCRSCIAIKPLQKPPAGLMLSSQTVVSRPFQLICADLVGPLPRSTSGYSYILVVCDTFSKFSLLFPLRAATALAVCRYMEDHVLLLFGIPDTIIVDNGVQFRSNEFRNLMKKYGTFIKYTPYYHPQANPCERVNKVVKTMLMSFVSENHRTWDKHLGVVGRAIRSTVHEVTGFSPNFLIFGRELPLVNTNSETKEDVVFDRSVIKSKQEAISQLYDDVKRKIFIAYEKNKKHYDLRRRPEQLVVNQLVWRKNYVLSDASKYFAAKLAPKFIGPYSISKKLSPWTYELIDANSKYSGVWHIKDLKAHPPDNDD